MARNPIFSRLLTLSGRVGGIRGTSHSQPLTNRFSIRAFSTRSPGAAPPPSAASLSMTQNKQKARLYKIGGLFLGLGSVAYVVLSTLEDQLMFYYTPSQLEEQVEEGNFKHSRKVRLGGLVVEESVKMFRNSLEVEFDLTDLGADVHVTYEGVLPDLFREGQSAVIEGYYGTDATFRATTVLAKHDENYMPKEVADVVNQKKAEAERKRLEESGEAATATA